MTTPVVSQRPVLLVDDEPALLRSASLLLRAAGIEPILTLDDSRLVLSRVADDTIGVVVLDLTMPHLSGQTLLEQITAHDPDLPTIVMTATHDLETAVQCMQAGAIDYLVKPVDKYRLVASVRRALERRALQEEVGSLIEHPRCDTPLQRQAFAEIVTQNTAMQALFRYVAAIAQSPQPVLITGETGTGKELMARAVHRLHRATRRLCGGQCGWPRRSGVFRHPVRAYARSLYRRRPAPRGFNHPGGGGHTVSGRDWRPGGGLPGQAAAPLARWHLLSPRGRPPAAESGPRG